MVIESKTKPGIAWLAERGNQMRVSGIVSRFRLAFRKILALSMACVLAFGMMPLPVYASGGQAATSLVAANVSLSSAPSSSVQAAESVQVKITAQAEGTFLFGPETSVSVSSDLAESYGYSDSVEGGVSALDALVKAHELWLVDMFTIDTAKDFLDPGNGFVQNMFGMGSEDCGFLVNSAYPGSSTVLNARINEGDAVDFFVLQDESNNNNHISWFTSNGAYAESVTAAPGATVDLKIAGVAFQSAYSFSSVELMHASGQGVQNAHTAWVDEYGVLTDIEGAVSAADGSVGIAAPESEGTYRLTAYVDTGDFGYYSPPLIMSILDVVVDASASSSAGPCDLASLEVADFNTWPAALSLSPVFDGGVTSYTTPVVDYQSDAFWRMCYVRAVVANESAVMSATLNDNGSISALKSDGGAWSNFGSSTVLEPGNNMVTVTVAASDAPDAETKSYTVVIPMRDENGNDPDPLPGPDDPQPNEKVISSAADVPEAIEEGEVYVLANDITFDSGQQITSIAGMLDGRGHTITLAGASLANDITGTVQNLGVAGEVNSSNSYDGSFCTSFTGIIRMCHSTALITSGWESGGLVGTIENGLIQNSYFAGTLGDWQTGGFVGYGKAANAQILDSYYTQGLSPCAMGQSFPQLTNVEKKTVDELKLEGAKLLNANAPSTGFFWTYPDGGGLPVLAEGDAPEQEVDRSALDAAIAEAETMTEDGWSASSWTALQTALESAKSVSSDADQATVDSAVKVLRDALASLERERPTEPVAIPDGSNVIEIKSAADFTGAFDDGKQTEGVFYALTADITLSKGDYVWMMNDFEGVLDGQGHTITLDGKTKLFDFANIGETGIVQNTRFVAASVGNASGAQGVLGNALKGAVLNCGFDVQTGTGLRSSGIAKTLDGGVISNCYVIGSPQNAFVSEAASGRILNSYWMESVNNPLSAECMMDCSAMAGSDMRTLAFVAQMNTHRGTAGAVWGQNSDGYPYFGPNLPYTEPGTEPNEYEVLFTPATDGASSFVIEGQLAINRADVDQFQKAGTLSLPDYDVPEGCSIEWNSNHRDIRCTLDTGELYAAVVGEAIITADLIGPDGAKISTLAFIPVAVIEGNMEDIKLFVNDTDVTDGVIELAGSEEARIVVHARFSGSDEYRPVNPSLFTYMPQNQELIDKEPQYASFHFEKPGETVLEVACIADPSVKAAVSAKSTYVAAQSIKPGISGTFTVHGRNANDWQSHPPRFNPDRSGVVIEPSNASYTDCAYWSISSSDESIGVYTDDAYVPVSGGTVTYTATLIDPQTGAEVSGTSEVTYEYANPLQEVSAPSASIALPRNTKQDISLVFSGVNDDAGWSVTEPSLEWSYDKEGIVSIYRSGSEGSWKRVEGAPDYNVFVLSAGYEVEAFAEGTVVATGTPVDQTAGAKPVVLTITVTPGEDLSVVDIGKIVSGGSSVATQNLAELHASRGYSYGDEWDVLALLRSGAGISPDDLSAYYWSVVEEVKSWRASEKPTDIERVALALTSMGKDITDVEGVDLAAMIYNHPTLLRQGYNAVIFALIALDAAGIEPPSDAIWTRASLLSALLEAQHGDGGFGLTLDGASGIDITAMALQALAPYRTADGSSDVDRAIERGIAYLAGQLQKPQYSYSTSEAQSQVIMALAVLGVDPLEAGFGNEYRNIFSSFMDSFASGDGGFSTVPGGETTAMSTAQALQAFESYRRYAAGEESFWQLSSQPERPVNPKPSEPDVPEDSNGQSGNVDPADIIGGGDASRMLGGVAASETLSDSDDVSGVAVTGEESLWKMATQSLEEDRVPLAAESAAQNTGWWLWILPVLVGAAVFAGAGVARRRNRDE